jgi:hypothetical protein
MEDTVVLSVVVAAAASGWLCQLEVAPGGRGGFQSTSQRDELKH